MAGFGGGLAEGAMIRVGRGPALFTPVVRVLSIPCTKSSSCAIACRATTGRTWLQVFAVSVMEECRRFSCTTRMATPASSSNVAQVWRQS
jgi:hypothetical protein